MKMKLVDNASDWWKMSSVRIQGLWMTACTIFLGLSEESQIRLLTLVRDFKNPVAAAEAVSFIAMLCLGVSGSTVLARLTKQNSVSGS